MNFGLTLYRGQEGDDIAEHFLKSLFDYGLKINHFLNMKNFSSLRIEDEDIIITKEQEEDYINCDICHICEKLIDEDEGDVKAIDHDHINKLYLGCCHYECYKKNLKKNLKYLFFFIT